MCKSVQRVEGSRGGLCFSEHVPLELKSALSNRKREKSAFDARCNQAFVQPLTNGKNPCFVQSRIMSTATRLHPRSDYCQNSSNVSIGNACLNSQIVSNRANPFGMVEQIAKGYHLYHNKLLMSILHNGILILWNSLPQLLHQG